MKNFEVTIYCNNGRVIIAMLAATDGFTATQKAKAIYKYSIYKQGGCYHTTAKAVNGKKFVEAL